MALVVERANLVAVAIDDTARALARPGEVVLVIAELNEDGGSHVRIRIRDGRVTQHFWVPRAALAILSDQAVGAGLR